MSAIGTESDLLDYALELLTAEADKLDLWAEESRRGGWSTHQVAPMEERANFLRREIARIKRSTPR